MAPDRGCSPVTPARSPSVRSRLPLTDVVSGVGSVPRMGRGMSGEELAERLAQPVDGVDHGDRALARVVAGGHDRPRPESTVVVPGANDHGATRRLVGRLLAEAHVASISGGGQRFVKTMCSWVRAAVPAVMAR
jgi:hypothetical protein